MDGEPLMGATVRTFYRSFTGGEITPEMYGMIGDIKFQTGLALCRNFVVLPHGPVENRAGFEFVREVKRSDKRTRLLPFTFNIDQTIVLEFGEEYFRFHTQGATVLDSGVPYEIAHPYQEDELFAVRFVQSADVVTLTHPNHPVQELRRLGATNWQLVAATFGAGIAAPAAPSVVATTAGASNLRNYSYVVTALKDGAESLPSSAATTSNNLNAASTYNTITVATVVGATGYNVYRLEGGLYYLIAVLDAAAAPVTDDNLPYNGGITPPTVADPFAAANPIAVTYHEQRKAFGGTLAQPQNLWITRSGTEGNFNYSVPPRDADSIQFRIAAREYNQIMHLAPLQDLIILTSAGEWRLGTGGDALTPDSFALKPQSYIGSGQAAPLTVNSNLLFAAARGGHLREMAYAEQAGGYLTGDLSIRAPHLFDGYDIVDMAYAKAPIPTVWATSTSGKLLGLTYIPEQQVAAWHQHDTQGAFESVAVVAEPEQDAVYVVVRREIDGGTRRYVERKRARAFETLADAFFVDAGASYSGAPIQTLDAGLDHLEGCEVAILVDGAVHPRRTVVDGQIALDVEAAKISVGLPYDSDLQTLPFAIEMQGAGQGRPKNVNQVFLRVFRSSGIFAGPSFDKLTEAKIRTTEPYGSPPDLKTGEVSIAVGPAWSADGQICIRQDNPLPLTILSMAPETVLAG